MDGTMPRWKLPILLIVWIAIQWVACLLPFVLVRRSYVQCQQNTACRDKDKAMLWDTRRGYVAVLAAQFIQPIASVLLLDLLKSSKTRGGHVAKAVGVGLAAAVFTCLIAFYLYQHYPRPGYWSLGNMTVEVYLTVPIFQAVSAIGGGIAVGFLDWRFTSTDLAQAKSS